MENEKVLLFSFFHTSIFVSILDYIFWKEKKVSREVSQREYVTDFREAPRNPLHNILT